MFTIKQIKNGNRYFKNYLAVKEYYTEGAKEGAYWLGEGARLLGLEGPVEESDFRAIATNRHPATGEKLTQRALKNSLHDITFSAPKAVSILAVIGEDERVAKAFRETVAFAHEKLETFAAVRLRGGANYATENVRFTRNLVTAVFLHDDSRALDPQLHAHLVTGNCSYDAKRGAWYALQSRLMMEVSKTSLREEANQFLASKLRMLGYNASAEQGSIRVEGISIEMEQKMSQRSRQREEFRNRYRKVLGIEPTKRRVEMFIKEGKVLAEKRFIAEYESVHGKAPSVEQVNRFVSDWRGLENKKISSDELRKVQLTRWNEEELKSLQKIVQKAKGNHDVANAGTRRIRLQDFKKRVMKRNQQSSTPDRSSLKVSASKIKESAKRETSHKRKAMRAVRQGRGLTLALQGRPGLAFVQAVNQKASRRNRAN